MLAGEACNRDVVVMEEGGSILEAAKLMREYHVGSVVVTRQRDGQRAPVGIFTDRDIVVELVAAEADLAAISVGDAMSFELVTVNESDGLFEALEAMRRKGVRRAPVLDRQGALVGVLAVDDIIEFITEQLANVVALMNREQRSERRARA